jgi:hypothetical protein
MDENEYMAKQIAEMQDDLRDQENQKGQNWMIPAPPKPGEIIHCRLCGEPMYPKDFSKDPKIRKREFKWQQHFACEQRMFDECDLQTPGLLSERKNGLRAGRQLNRPVSNKR